MCLRKVLENFFQQSSSGKEKRTQNCRAQEQKLTTQALDVNIIIKSYW